MKMQTVSEKREIESRAFKRTRVAQIEQPSTYKWTVKEYYQLGELGFFQGKRVELIRGEILQMAPMKTPHAAAIQIAAEVLSNLFSKGYRIRQQLPLRFSESDEPEPDIAIVKGTIRDYLESHPETALLVVEVSDTTLKFDKNEKATIYSEFGISDYWVLDVKNRQLHIYRKPMSRADGGFYYAEQTIYQENQSVSPLAKPKSRLKVADLLP